MRGKKVESGIELRGLEESKSASTQMVWRSSAAGEVLARERFGGVFGRRGACSAGANGVV